MDSLNHLIAGSMIQWLEDRRQRAPQIGILEGVATRYQLGGLHALAGKEQFICHLAKGEACDESWHGKEGRAGEHRGQRLGEFPVCHRLRRDYVYRSLEQVVFQDVVDGADPVLDVNPTPPLAAAAHISTHPQTEWKQHFLQGAASRAKD